MEQNKVKILVACHKPDEVYSDEVYTPIHVGRAISTCTDQMKGMIGDDTGDNISHKNKSYCELTAQYWGWKNLNCEYIGLCHYRRYFKEKITNDNIDELMKDCDIIVANRVYIPHNLIHWLKYGTVAEDAYILYMLLVNKYPEFKDAIDQRFTKTNYIFPCNMMVCKKTLFDSFAEWQFSVLKEAEGLITPSGYARLKRNMGYFGEALLNIYTHIYNLRVKEMSLVSMIGEEKAIMKQTWTAKLKHKIHFMIGNKNFNWNYAVIAGLKSDGIYQKLNK